MARKTMLGVLLPGFVLTASGAAAFEATGDLRLWTDYGVFRMTEASPNAYVEFYFEMKRADFTFRLVDSVLRADVHTWVHVADSTGADFDSIGGAFVSSVSDSSELADTDYTVFFARALALPTGSYQVRMVTTDLADKSSAESRFTLDVPGFSPDKLCLSTIEFGYDAFEVPTDTSQRHLDVLAKNGYKIYPDCRGLVGQSRPRLFFYLEAYNLDFDPTRDNPYTVEFSIIPTDGTPEHTLGLQTLTKPGSSAVLVSSVPVHDLQAGLYSFRAKVNDPASRLTAEVEKSFQVVLPSVDTLTAEEIVRLREIIAYIARPAEILTFDRLGSAGKRNFMIQFWKDRDPTPGIPGNEFRDEHMRRMNYANGAFSIGFRDRSNGWRTDRGRVYVVYGDPDQVQRYPFTPDLPPAELWYFDNLPGQGSAYFLFLDEAGFGDYRMVHSTARGERRDPNWERKVEQGEFDRMR